MIAAGYRPRLRVVCSWRWGRDWGGGGQRCQPPDPLTRPKTIPDERYSSRLPGIHYHRRALRLQWFINRELISKRGKLEPPPPPGIVDALPWCEGAYRPPDGFSLPDGCSPEYRGPGPEGSSALIRQKSTVLRSKRLISDPYGRLGRAWSSAEESKGGGERH